MKLKPNIQKFFTVAIWSVVVIAMFLILIAAMRNKQNETCSHVAIRIKNTTGGNTFLSVSTVKKMLPGEDGNALVGRPIETLVLDEIEAQMEKNKWIKNAELYFDKKNVLHINVLEKTPMARVFTSSGSSYYLSNEIEAIPLSNNYSANVPVFTNVPAKNISAKEDSICKTDIVALATVIGKDSFWNALIAQIEVEKSVVYPARYEMNLIPIVGNQEIKFGICDDINKKLGRLFLFYKNVLAKTGFEKYASIDVRFAGQVIANKTKPQKAMLAALPTVKIDSTISSKKAIAKSIPEKLVDKKIVTPTKTVKKQVEKQDENKNTERQDAATNPKAVMPILKKTTKQL